MVAAGRRTQVVAAPVIHHVLPATVLCWKTSALMEGMVWTGATHIPLHIVLWSSLVLLRGWSARIVVGAAPLVGALSLSSSILILTISIALGK